MKRQKVPVVLMMLLIISSGSSYCTAQDTISTETDHRTDPIHYSQKKQKIDAPVEVKGAAKPLNWKNSADNSKPTVQTRPPMPEVPDDNPSQSKATGLPSNQSGTVAPRLHTLPINDLILSIVSEMPDKGIYSTSKTASTHLASAIKIEDERLLINPSVAKPSFCSAATYLVFLSVLERLNQEQQVPLTRSVMQDLLVRGQADGEGVWGRWNANGPGTARLFYELNIGRNFTSFEEARPGDFLKIFWNENIGSTEHGHSVIYLGAFTAVDGTESISFWSSNKPDGYGIKSIPKSKIIRALFSRLDQPEYIGSKIKVVEIPDEYLASMSKQQSSPEEMLRMVGISERPHQPSANSTPVKQLGSPVEKTEVNRGFRGVPNLRESKTSPTPYRHP